MKKILSFVTLACVLSMGLIACSDANSQPSGSIPPKAEYSVTWLDYNDTQLRVDTVIEGTLPSYGSIPTREADIHYTYEFAGWTPEIVAASSNATYRATYNAVPISQISKDDFDIAMNFYGKNFTVNFDDTNDYHEVLAHDENNAYYTKFSNGDSFMYRAMKHEHDDVMAFFCGVDVDGGIAWSLHSTNQIGNFPEYAFDQYAEMQKLMEVQFDDLTYNEEQKCYSSSAGGVNWTLKFAGPRLLSAVKQHGDFVENFTFSNYGQTTVKYDDDLNDYVNHMYPTKEVFKDILENGYKAFYPTDQRAQNGSLEYELHYYEDGERVELFKIHFDDSYFQFIYNGDHDVCGTDEGSFVWTIGAEKNLELDSDDDTYYPTDDRPCNPFLENTLGTRSNTAHKFISEEILGVQSLDNWENYQVEECGVISFDLNEKHYIFRVRLNDSNNIFELREMTVTFTDGETKIKYELSKMNTAVERLDINVSLDD